MDIIIFSVIVGEDSSIFGSKLPGDDDDDDDDDGDDDERDQEGGAVFNSSSWLPGRDSKYVSSPSSSILCTCVCVTGFKCSFLAELK